MYFFNSGGLINKFNTSYPIIEADLNSKGMIGVVTENSNEHIITIYSKDKTKIAIGNTDFKSDGYPLDIDLSDNGYRLITSYIYTDGGAIESRLTFYDYSNFGENYTDRIVGTFIKKDFAIPYVEYITNEDAVAVGNKGLFVYNVESKPKELSEIKIDREIKSVFKLGSQIGIIIKEEQKQNKYELSLYNFDGVKKRSIEIDFEYKDIVTNNKEIILYNDLECLIYTKYGQLKSQYHFDSVILQVLPVNNNYLIVTSNETKIIK